MLPSRYVLGATVWVERVQVTIPHSGVSSHDLAHYLAHQGMKKGSTKEPRSLPYLLSVIALSSQCAA